MENITASEVAGFGVGTLLLCATIAAPKVDAFISASQRRLILDRILLGKLSWGIPFAGVAILLQDALGGKGIKAQNQSLEADPSFIGLVQEMRRSKDDSMLKMQRNWIDQSKWTIHFQPY
ncbi:hypothetical protein COLO4_08471 [Corchorus olitorius]|uniref:Uncharacterized protein n=1 Tax=Corchorus olitorius TaxID=93759 RepID=A0A1R3KFL9_9ROSI|nr:hypothetical protein COLO4_08471 [Corchorus olitorius]